ncbi:MAG: CHAD domain-containing protein [Steroidobacteraceae bacterium]
MNRPPKTGEIEPSTIRFRTTRDLQSQLHLPTPASIHEVRQAARSSVVRVRALQPVLGHGSFPGLRKSLCNLIDITAESRDAEVQRRVIVRMQAQKAKQGARRYGQLLLKLTQRQLEATRDLARYLDSDIGSEHLRQLNEDLSALALAQSGVNVPPLASRRCRHVLRDIEKQLAGKIAASHRVHPLRVKIRRARSLASLSEGAPGVVPSPLNHKLNKMQEALGDLRDSMLLRRWIKRRGLTLAPQVKVALETMAKRCLKRCKGYRKPLRHAIRQYLRKTRQ